MKDKIYIVEGLHDVQRLKAFNKDLKVISINGSAIDQNIKLLETLEPTHEFVLCLDPDYPGEKIRKQLETRFKNVSHIFVQKEHSYSKNRKKIGIEHISDCHLKEAFLYEIKKEGESDLSMDFLNQLGLVGTRESKQKRIMLCDYLHIGYANGKTFLKRLQWMGLSKEKLIEVINESST